MNDILLEPSPLSLARALEVNLHAHAPPFGKVPCTTLWQEPGFLAILTRLDPAENTVYLARCTPEEAEWKIAQALERNQTQGCQPLFWQVGPSTTPPDFGQYLLKCGFSFVIRVPGMAADLRNLHQSSNFSSDLVIEPVRSEALLTQWTDVLAQVDGYSEALKDGFARMFADLGLGPGGQSQLFLGISNGRMVATSRMFCAGGVAGIWHVATLPEARGRGYGTAMTLAAARAGLDNGYRFGILYATPAGLGVYCRLGFREYSHIDVYKSPQA